MNVQCGTTTSMLRVNVTDEVIMGFNFVSVTNCFADRVLLIFDILF